MKDSFITISHHAKERSYERYGFNENTLLLLAEKAVMKGFSYNDAPSKWIGEYLLSKIHSDRRVYYNEGRLFIFTKDFVLTTTYPVPRNILKGIERCLKHS